MNFLFVDIYRQSFNETNVMLSQWDDNSLYLYCGILLLTFLFGWMIEKKRLGDERIDNKNRLYIITIGLFLVSILGLRGINVGVDTLNYRESFEHSLDKDAFGDSTIEPGYRLLCGFFRTFFSYSEIYILLISGFTVYFVINTIWKYRDRINVFIALIFYVGLYYFQAMNLMRIFLAMSILLFFFHYLLEGKYIKYIIVVLLTATLHFSSLVMLVVVAMLWLYQRSKIVAIATFVSLMILLIPLSLVFGDYILLARYANYASGNDSSRQVGIMLYFDYLPCFVVISYAIKNRIKNQWTDLLVVNTLVAFLMRFIAYYIEIAGRLGIHFSALYLILIPYFVNHIRLYHRKSYPLTLLLLVFFLLVRVHFYFIGYLAVDGIMPYSFVWDDKN